MKEKIEITIRANGSMNNPLYLYLNSERGFEIEVSRALLFRSLEAFEKKLKKLYPIEIKKNEDNPLPAIDGKVMK